MFTIIYYTDDWHTAERMADAERRERNRAGVREARVFRDAEACDKVVILPCVDADARARIVAAYGDKVVVDGTYVTVAEATAFFEAGANPPAISDEDKADALKRAAEFLAGSPPHYEAKHRGRGSYSVMRNGVEVVEGLTKLEADAFKTYSPAEQAAFVANRAKG